MAKFRKRGIYEEDFQMAPMIDMVFLLLVFFMCVSTLVQEEWIPLELPSSAEAQVVEGEGFRWVVSLDPEGNVYLGGHLTDIDSLREHLERQASRLGGTELRLQLRAGPETPFAEIREFLRMSAEVGIEVVQYATLQE